jgi:hypothetical protein
MLAGRSSENGAGAIHDHGSRDALSARWIALR